MQVDLGGLDRPVAKPMRDHRTVDAGLEDLHRRTVPKDLRRHPLAAERGALLHLGLHMLGQQALGGVGAEGPAMDVWKKHRRAALPGLLEPGMKGVACLLGERGASLLAALTEAADMRAGAQDDGVTLELDDLAQPQAGLHGEQEQHEIAPADPCAPVWRRQERVAVLQALVEEICQDRIAQFRLEVAARPDVLRRRTVPLRAARQKPYRPKLNRAYINRP